MAWQVKYFQDTETKGTGTLIFTNGSFSHSRRIDINNTALIDALITQVKTAFALSNAEESEVTTIEATITAKLGD